jgi:hypothetical protein
MHLTSAQSKRFYDLFNRFTTCVNEQQGINNKLFDRRGRRVDEELLKVTTYIWEHPELIDEFVSKNPLKLKRQDLETIHSWRYVIKGKFLLMEHLPQYSALLANDHIFKVTGISQDIVEIVPRVPSFIETALLPFEDKIVYSVSIVSHPIKYGAGILQIFDDDYEKAKKKDAYVGNTIEFIKASKDYYADEHNRELDRAIDEYEREQRKLKDELPAGMHKGALAGKTDEERWETIRASLDKSYGSAVQKMIQNEMKAIAWRHKPQTDLKGTLKCMPRKSLEDLLLHKGLPVDSLLKKDDLVGLLANMPDGFKTTLAPMLEICSTTQFKMFCRLMEEKGILWVQEDEATVEHMECTPMPPYLNLYYNQHQFAYTMPSELLDDTTAIDMDAIANRRKDLEAIGDYAMIMSDLYGIVSVDDFLAAYAKNHPDPLDEESAFNILNLVSFTSATGWELWENDENLEDDELYIISTALLDDDEDEEDEDLSDYRQYLIARHQQIPLKQYDIENIRQIGLFDYVTSAPEVRALRDYLDAHVPDDQEDLYFADNIIDALYGLVDWTSHPSDIIDFLSDRGLLFDADNIDEANDMLEALTAATNAMPHWTNNGWTPNELVASMGDSRPGSKGELIDFATGQKIGRNDPCPCGSGKKYKKCHGRSDEDAAGFDGVPVNNL